MVVRVYAEETTLFEPDVVLKLSQICVFEVHRVITADEHRAHASDDVVELLHVELGVIWIDWPSLEDVRDLSVEGIFVELNRTQVPHDFLWRREQILSCFFEMLEEWHHMHAELLEWRQVVVWPQQCLWIEVPSLRYVNDKTLGYLELVLTEHEVVLLDLNDVSDDGVSVRIKDTLHTHVKSLIQEDEEEGNRDSRDQDETHNECTDHALTDFAADKVRDLLLFDD